MRYRETTGLLILVGWMLSVSQLAAAWFGGGGFDGHDQVRVKSASDYPQVHNAAGATNVTEFGATLTGMLTATGSAPAQVVVYWAQSDGGRDVAAWLSAPGADHHVFGDYGEVVPFEPLSLEITAISGKAYYYRFFVTNTVGESGWAVDTDIFVIPSPPSVTTGAGAAVGINTAVLNGALTAGIEADLWLDWGTTEPEIAPPEYVTLDLGRRVVEGTVDYPNPFRVELDTLTPGATYAYRIRGENDFGQSATPWVWFTMRPVNFIKTPDLGWAGGGAFDGYDRLQVEKVQLPGTQGGTLLMVR